MLGFGHDVDKAGGHSNEVTEVVLGQLLRKAPDCFAGPSLRSSVHRNVEEDREEGFTVSKVGVAPRGV